MSARREPIVLGLTGGVGCGKTTAAKALSELGAAVVDADAISRELTAPGGAALSAIRERFGDGVFLADGTFDRAAMGERVFHDAAERRDLESILHPAIQREMLRRMDAAAKAEAAVVVLDVPLLYETGLDALCDEVWVVTVAADQQIMRIMNRDQITRAQAVARIESQMPLADKEARADRVFQTGKPIADVKNDLAHAYKDLLRRRPL